MTTMTLPQSRITAGGMNTLVKLGQRVHIGGRPEPIVGVWLTLDTQLPHNSLVTATVLDDVRGVQQVTFHPANLSLPEGDGPSEKEAKALNALALTVSMQRTQAGEFESWKRAIAERAGEVANEHGFCGVYDDLMEEFGLPILRDEDFDVSVVIRATVTISARSQDAAEDSIEWSDIFSAISNYTPDWEVEEEE